MAGLLAADPPRAGLELFQYVAIADLRDGGAVLVIVAVLLVLGRLCVSSRISEAGLFSGAAALFGTLVLAVNRFRDRFDERAMRIMNRIAGLAIGAFGVVTFLIVLKHGR